MTTYPLTIPGLVARATREFGERDFVVTPDERLTFADADRRSGRLAHHLLAAGVTKGEHVGVLHPQGPDFVVALLAVTRIGAVAVPLSTFLRGDELRRAIVDTDIELLLAPADLLGRRIGDELEDLWPELRASAATHLSLRNAPALRHVWLHGDERAWATGPDHATDPIAEAELLDAVERDVDPADPMMIVLTSGSTAAPKAVVHGHGAQVRQARKLAALYELDEDVRTFTTMPFFWVGGLTVVVLSHLHAGGRVLTVARIDGARMLDLIEHERATRLAGWTVAERLRAEPTFAGRDFSWLPDLASAPVDPQSRHGSLGMTETGGPHTGMPVSENQGVLPEAQRGSFGRPLPGMEHKIVDPGTGAELGDGVEGEICVRGDCLMLGILHRGRHEVFDEDGWYHTGDHGFFRDGLLFFTGRHTEMIKTAGANVAPREVELALEALPGVQAAFVVGLDDRERGQVVGCVLCPEDGCELDADDVLHQLAKHLSSFKLPRRVVVMPRAEAPSMASGKVDKAALAELLAADRPGS
jgi:acyl-CoA synthetase (AMP-forming)/AMP-acid ligase II